MMDKSCMYDPLSLEPALQSILEDVLLKSEKECPWEASIKKYQFYTSIVTDPLALKHCLRQLKKANTKLAESIFTMEEAERKEAEKLAFDQEEADRKEKLRNELLNLLKNSEFSPLLEQFDSGNIDESVKNLREMISSCREKSVELHAVLSSLL